MASHPPSTDSSPSGKSLKPKPPGSPPAAKAKPPKPAVAKAVPAEQQAMAAKAASASQPEEEELEEEEQVESGGRRFLFLNAVPSWMVSMVVHAVILLVLALLTVAPDEEPFQNVLNVAPSDNEEIEEFQLEEIDPVDVESFETEMVADVQADVPEEVTEVAVSTDLQASAMQVELSNFSDETAPRNDLLAEIGGVTGQGLEGRGEQARAKLAKQAGATEASEAAVAKALKWLADHQLPDGGWSFDHRVGACQGRCSHAGSLQQARNGATAMALLPFLGAGQTHKEGKYKKTVQGGLYFLVNNMKPHKGNPMLGDLTEGGGSMYSHGLCSIVLCEAYAMTNDRALMDPAQASLNFIVYAQDPVGGGWRYQPKQPGDTSAVGWQLMALKSGHMAYLQVPPATIVGANRFLDSVAADSGARYGYTGPGQGAATSAIGLLCRMYLGWKKDHPGIERGVQWISKAGPSKGNMYYNYYATQVMRHHEGEPWDKWNVEMRDYLVETQDQSGHQTGSWHLKGDHGTERGGRLYCTSMATMILEVYYRHLPIYGAQAAEEDFPL